MSKEEEFRQSVKKLYHQLMLIVSAFIVFGMFILHYIYDPEYYNFGEENSEYVAISENDLIFENGIHLDTGFKQGEGILAVINNCTNCHSSKLVIQNRMSKERWNALIRWMQETQNLWDLGDNHEVIVEYLVTNYPVEDVGRRANLSDIEWYELED